MFVYTVYNVVLLTIVVYMAAVIPIHVMLSHTGIPIALKITDSSITQYNQKRLHKIIYRKRGTLCMWKAVVT